METYVLVCLLASLSQRFLKEHTFNNLHVSLSVIVIEILCKHRNYEEKKKKIKAMQITSPRYNPIDIYFTFFLIFKFIYIYI